MNIAEISKYKKFVERGLYENTQLEKLSDRYSQQEQQSISHLEILFSSTRAESIVKNGISYKCIVDYGKSSKSISDSDSSVTREIWTKHSDNIKSGDILLYTPNGDAEENYLLVNTKEIRNGYDLGAIKRCISSLKWLDENGAIKEAPFAISTDMQTIGLKDDKVMVMPSERRYVAVQNNSDTVKIKKSQRFIFDRDRCWLVTGINTLTTGLITFELEETQLNSVDNVELRIADYFIHDYTIHISNGSTVNLAASDTLQLDVVAKDNGTITNLPTTYSSSDSSIITVSETGLITAISNGTASIQVSLTNSPSIIDTLSVTVSDVVQSGWTLDINGSDFCKTSQIQKFTGTVKNNGVTDTSKLIRWTLYDDSGTVPTALANIITQSGSEVVIKASKQFGYLKIKGTCYANNSLTVEDIATFSVADLSTLTVDDLASVGFDNQNAEQFAVQNVNGLFNLGLTTEQVASMTVEDLSSYTVGDLANQTVLVSAMKSVQIKGLI